jgi:chromosome segregation ATPase
MHPRHRQPTRAELQLLLKENDGLRTEIVRLRRELSNKQDCIGRLEVLLHERMERIDELTAQVDQLRHQIKKLDQEAEHLAAMVANQRGMTAEAEVGGA